MNAPPAWQSALSCELTRERLMLYVPAFNNVFSAHPFVLNARHNHELVISNSAAARQQCLNCGCWGASLGQDR